MPSSKLASRDIIAFVVLGLLVLTWFVWLSSERLIARDEGFYLLATRLVLEGQLLYRDFFFPQGPVFPLVYALPFAVFDSSWNVARFSAAFLATCVTILTALIARRLAGTAAVVLATILMCTCNIFWAWQSSAQAYGVTLTLLGLTFFLLPYGSAGFSGWRLFFCGLALALTGLTRVYFFALLPVVLWYLLTLKNTQISSKRRVIYFLFGATTPLAICLIVWRQELDLLYYNLIGYHLNRADGGTTGSLESKLDLLTGLFGLRSTEAFSGRQYVWLFILALTGGWSSWKNNSYARLLLISLLIIFTISLLPNPSYIQYFGLTVPLCAVLGSVGLNKLLNIFKQNILTALLITALLITYNLNLGKDLTRYTRTGEGVIGINNQYGAAIWNLKSVKEVQQALDQNTNKNEIVLSFWPGYLLESQARSFPGLENHFALRAARPLSPAQRMRYRVYRWDHIMQVMAEHPPAAIVGKADYFPPVFENFLEAQNYKVVWKKNMITIMKRQTQ